LSDVQSHARDAIELQFSDLVADVPGLTGTEFGYDPRDATTGITFADGAQNSLESWWKVPVNEHRYRALANEDFWTVYATGLVTSQQVTNPPTERDRAIKGVKESLKALVDRGVFSILSVAEHAQALLASSDGDACAFFLRERLVEATDKAMLAAGTPTRQKSIYAIYEEARYRLSVLDHLDWRPNLRAWQADGAVFGEDAFREIIADGGCHAIGADQQLQLKWQDVLDHVLQTRFYAVRDALRGSGDDGYGVAGSPLNLLIDGQTCHVVAEFGHGGAGRNVVAMRYVVRQGKSELVSLDERMAMDSADMAIFIRRQTQDALRLQHAHDAIESEALPDTHAELPREPTSDIQSTNEKADMGTSDTPSFTPTDKQILLGEALLVARVHEAMVRPIVEGYQKAILAKHQFKLASRWADTRLATDESITEGRDSYLLSDEDFAVYHQACHEARDAEGLKVSKPDNCPLLEAVHERIQYENALLGAWEGHSRFKALADVSVLSSDKRDQVIELTLGLLAPHMKDNAHAMLADLGFHPPARNTLVENSSPEP